jgi:hypothetical protein
MILPNLFWYIETLITPIRTANHKVTALIIKVDATAYWLETPF